MSKIKCPFFVSRSNGHKLYINCSKDKHINSNSIRKEFKCIEARKVCYEVNCCNDFYHCGNYQKLKAGD